MTQTPPRAPSGREDSSPAGESRKGKSRGLLLALVGSVLVHLGIMVAVLPPNFRDILPPEPKEEKPFEVNTYVEEVEPTEDLLAQNLPEAELESPDDPEEEEPEEEEEEEETEEPEEIVEEMPAPPETPPPPPPELNRKVVQQENNEEEAVDSQYLAEKANKVEEETRARETTQLDVLAGKTVPDDLKELTGGDEESQADAPEDEQELVAEVEEEPAAAEAEEASAQEEPEEVAQLPPEQLPSERTSPEKTEEGEAAAVEAPQESPFATKAAPKEAGEPYKPPPRSLFQPSAKDYEEVFGEADKKAASTMNRHKKGRRLLKGWKQREAAMRASLENANLEVRPGNHTGVNAAAAVYATFIARIHRKLHPRWGGGYLPRLDSDYGPSHPLSRASLEVTLEYIIDAASGAIEATNIVRTSGQTMFDAEAIVIFNEIGPHTGAPDEIISPDGKVYIHWTLWRDQQQCGPWGASIFIVDNGTKKRIDRGGNAGGDASRSGGR